MPGDDEGPASFAQGACENAKAFGLMRIGQALLALPVDYIREVILGRAAYASLPIDAEGLRGAIDLRGTVIPVLDLRPFLGLPPPEPQSGHGAVVVMSWGGRLLGLLADEVRGVVRAADARLFKLAIAQSDARLSLVTHGMRLGQETAALLDAGRVAALPNVPMVGEEAQASHRQSAGRESMLLFSDRGIHLAISALHVDATVPRLPIVRGALTGGYCLGTVVHHGQDIPVLETLPALGLGSAAKPADAALIVLRLPEGLIGFTLDDVRDIARPTADEIVSMPRLPGEAASLFRGLLTDAKGLQNLLLDDGALRRHAPFVALAGLSRFRPVLVGGADAARPSVSATAQVAARAELRQFITFQAGREYAVKLSDVLEILPYPGDLIDMRAIGGGMIGLFRHRSAVVPLLDFAERLGGHCTLDPASARVLLARAGNQTVGLAVEALHSIEPIAPGPSSTDLPAGEGHKSMRVVLVGEGARRRLLPQADLSLLLDAFAPDEDQPPAIETAPFDQPAQDDIEDDSHALVATGLPQVHHVASSP